jgi:hypothetical protein
MQQLDQKNNANLTKVYGTGRYYRFLVRKSYIESLDNSFERNLKLVVDESSLKNLDNTENCSLIWESLTVSQGDVLIFIRCVN